MVRHLIKEGSLIAPQKLPVFSEATSCPTAPYLACLQSLLPEIPRDTCLCSKFCICNTLWEGGCLVPERAGAGSCTDAGSCSRSRACYTLKTGICPGQSPRPPSAFRSVQGSTAPSHASYLPPSVFLSSSNTLISHRVLCLSQE